MAQAIDFFVDCGVFFDISIGRGDISFGLVIVEVRDEIMNLVFWEELAKLGLELGSEGFIVGENEGRFPVIFNQIRHRKSFSGAGYAEEDLFLNSLL